MRLFLLFLTLFICNAVGVPENYPPEAPKGPNGPTKQPGN